MADFEPKEGTDKAHEPSRNHFKDSKIPVHNSPSYSTGVAQLIPVSQYIIHESRISFHELFNREMDSRKIAVIVEDVEVARTALKWALNNLMRYGDCITLLHVFPSSTASKIRHLRLNGYRLALNFKELCAAFPDVMLQTKVEIIVTEGDQEGRVIAAMVREIGASVLVVGLHDHSFLYKMAMAQDDLARTFSCKVVAIKQATASTEYSQKPKNVEVIAAMDSSINLGFSQIEIAKLEAPEIIPRKIPYRIFPDPSAIIWRWKKSRRRWTL